MELVFWYVVIGVMICGISTLIHKIKYYGLPLEFKPSGLLISITLWPLILLALIIKLLMWALRMVGVKWQDE